MTRVRFAESFNLDGHMALLREILEESLRDPEVMSLAARITSGAYDGHAHEPQLGRPMPTLTAWGQQLWAPRSDIPSMKDDLGELGLLWEFGVLNLRYVYDMNHYDGFKTIRRQIIDRAGDCDDQTILLCGLARAIGFDHVFAKVISVEGDHWEHVYPVIGVGKDDGSRGIPMDMSVAGSTMGWEAPHASERLFRMS